MADQKISALTELTALADDDEFVAVDKSDTSMAASGTDKRVLRSTILPTSLSNLTSPPAAAPASVVTGVANTYYVVDTFLFAARTITSLRYRVGTTSSGNVRCALYDTAGTKVLDKTSDAAQPAALLVDTVTFDTPTVMAAGRYRALVWFSSATATFMGTRYLTPSVTTGTNATTTPTSVAAGSTLNADFPILAII